MSTCASTHADRNRAPTLIGDTSCPTDLYRLLKTKMVICNNIVNFFVIVNNISYNKLEVEKIVD